VVLAVYAGGFLLGHPVGAARGAAFAALIVGNLGLILAHRSRSRTLLESLARHNRALWWIVGLAAATLVLVLALPGLRELFHFSEIRFSDALLGIGAGVGSMVWLELFDRVRRRRRPQAAP
jgi:P-type Ca2+ transporter type 2C